jgi:hypothetical protein
MHLTGSSRKQCRPGLPRQPCHEVIAEARSSADLRFLAHLMQFPGVLVTHRGVDVAVPGDELGDVRWHSVQGNSASVMKIRRKSCGVNLSGCPAGLLSELSAVLDLRRRISFIRARSSRRTGEGAAQGPQRAGSSIAHWAMSR